MFELQLSSQLIYNSLSIIEKKESYCELAHLEEDSLHITYTKRELNESDFKNIIDQYKPEDIITEINYEKMPHLYILPDHIEYDILYNSKKVGKINLSLLSLTTIQIDSIELIYDDTFTKEKSFYYTFTLVNEIKNIQPIIKKWLLSPAIFQ